MDRPSAGERGQSLAEFAIVLIPLSLLLLGAIQFGVIWGTQVGVTNAVRDSVRAASLVQPKADIGGNVTQASEQTFAIGIRSTVLLPALQKNVPFYSAASLATGGVCYTTVQNAGGSNILQATVSATYRHPVLIPLLSSILGGNSVSATASLSIPVGMVEPYTLPPVGTQGCAP